MKSDFSDVEAFFQSGMAEVAATENRVGREAVQYAADHGTYRNQTGKLRASNHFKVVDDGLELTNDARNGKQEGYGSFVEAKGFDVLASAALFAEKRLREEIA